MLSLKKLAFMNQRTRVIRSAQGLYINEFIILDGLNLNLLLLLRY